MTVTAPAPTGAAETVCRTLLGAAPGTVAGQTARQVSTDGAALAWGAPPIVLRCGVSAAGLTPGSRCDEVEGVGWYTEDLGQAYRFTTIGRQVPVEVTVPHAYAPEADALVDLAAAIKDADPVVEGCV